MPIDADEAARSAAIKPVENDATDCAEKHFDNTPSSARTAERNGWSACG